MRSTNGLMIDRTEVSALLASILILGKEQREAIHTELEKDPTGKDYEGKEPGDVLKLLNERKLGPNPTQRGRTAVQSIGGKELKTWLRSKLSRAMDGNKALKEKWGGLPSSIIATFAASEEVLATDADVTKLIGQLDADGLLQDGEVDTLFTVPEQEWFETILLPSRAEIVLGLEEVVLELSDLPDVLP